MTQALRARARSVGRRATWAVGLVALAGAAAPPATSPAARSGAGAPANKAEAAGSQALAQPIVIGAVLPLSGSPSQREYAEHFLEGAEVAVAQARADGVRVELVVRDNAGTPSGSARAAGALAASGAVAILGPLADQNFSAAASARPRGFPLLSPTATRLPDAGAVYSLAAPDHGAAATLAQAVARLGHRSAVVLRPRSEAAQREAAAFERAFREGRGIVTRTLVYQPGATTFADVLTEAGRIEPPLLVVLAAAPDLELLAPQIGFYGLDELNIQIAGTAAWTDPSLLASVARRHTDYVIAAGPRLPDDPAALAAADTERTGADATGVAQPPAPSPVGRPALAALVTAYEEHFKRSLASPFSATGYDLVRMVLSACSVDRCRPHQVAQAMDRLSGFEGATGTWSSSPQGLARDHAAVEIHGGRLYPVGAAPRPSA